MSPWKIARLNHLTCNVYYKMRHFQQTYLALVQDQRISDLLNNKPFVNSSKTAIHHLICLPRVIHHLVKLHLSTLNLQKQVNV
jgi:hypothetical protein